MKKRIISFILLLTSLALLLLLSSCTQGEKKTNTVFIDKNEKYGVCEHRWEMKSKTLPTCTREGETTMECTYCHKINTVVIPTGECEYNVYFHWYNNKSLPLLHFDCAKNAAHSFYVNCSLETVNVPKTCTERGSTIKIATATYNGVTYTDTLVKDLGLAAHDYNYTYELLGQSCEEGVKNTGVCEACGYVNQTVNYSHYKITDEVVYSFDELGLCSGGRAIRQTCLCGENKDESLTVYYSACDMEIERQTTKEAGVNYSTETQTCKSCGFSWTRKSAHIVPEGQSSVYYAYWLIKYTLNEDTVIVSESYDEDAHDLFGHSLEYTYNNIDDRWYHEEIATCTQCLYKHTKENLHKMKYTYEPLGETCLDGINANGVCLGCGYTTEFVTTSHQTASIEASYNLEDYGFCKGTINVEVCFCGYKRLTPSGLYWYSQRKYVTRTEKSDTLVLGSITETCSGCGFAIETVNEYTLIGGAWHKTNVITNIYLDEETTLTVKFPIQDPSGTLDRPLTKEELAALEKYFEWIRRQ